MALCILRLEGGFSKQSLGNIWLSFSFSLFFDRFVMCWLPISASVFLNIQDSKIKIQYSYEFQFDTFAYLNRILGHFLRNAY
jgi:hypothetical protein